MHVQISNKWPDIEGGQVETGLVSQGFDLMMFGMGTVFAFLTVLVFSTSIMSRVVARFFPEVLPSEPKAQATGTQVNQAVDQRTLNIIQQAVYQHRARTK